MSFIFEKFIGGLAVFAFLSVSPAASAQNAGVYFEGPVGAVSPGSELEIKVLLDAGEAINALSLEIFYPAALEFIGFNNRSSIIDLWHDGPKAYPDGRLELKGGLFRPFQGEKGEVMILEFRVKSEGVFDLNFLKSELYLADGRGTLQSAQNAPFRIFAFVGGEERKIIAQSDSTPPELEVQVVKDSAGDSKLLAFNSNDRESGVAASFLRTRGWLRWSVWQPILNPTRLPAGVWALEIRSFNNNNQETSKKIYLWGEFFGKFGLPTLGVIFIIITAILLYNKRRKPA